MAQRISGYKRKRNDAYYTPAWVTEALLPHIPTRIESVWEPAAGRGAIAKVLRKAGYSVRATDLSNGHDFMQMSADAQAIITNPPYRKDQINQFICRALLLTERKRGFVAMLLASDFDHAKGRRHLFGGCPQFSRKVVLTDRIVWFTPVIASPSSNHAWFIWDWQRKIKPLLAYHYGDSRAANQAR